MDDANTWSVWISLATAFLTLLTVFFMYLTFDHQRKHNIKSVSPLLHVFLDNLKENKKNISISIVNSGLGPATIYDILVQIKGHEEYICLFPKSNFNLFIDKVIKSNFAIPENCIDYKVFQDINGEVFIKQDSEFEFFNINLTNALENVQYAMSQLFDNLSFCICYGTLYDTKKPNYSEYKIISIEKFNNLIKKDVFKKIDESLKVIG
jgi:hypothetical protein